MKTKTKKIIEKLNQNLKFLSSIQDRIKEIDSDLNELWLEIAENTGDLEELEDKNE